MAKQTSQPKYIDCPRINSKLEQLLCLYNRVQAKKGVEFFKEFCGNCPRFNNSKFSPKSAGRIGVKISEPHETTKGY